MVMSLQSIHVLWGYFVLVTLSSLTSPSLLARQRPKSRFPCIHARSIVCLIETTEIFTKCGSCRPWSPCEFLPKSSGDHTPFRYHPALTIAREFTCSSTAKLRASQLLVYCLHLLVNADTHTHAKWAIVVTSLLLDFLQWDRGYTFVFINNTPNMMSVALYTHSVSPSQELTWWTTSGADIGI